MLEPCREVAEILGFKEKAWPKTQLFLPTNHYFSKNKDFCLTESPAHINNIYSTQLVPNKKSMKLIELNSIIQNILVKH